MIKFLRQFACVWLPWHKTEFVEKLSRDCEKARCRYCGMEYGVHLTAGIMLPWDDVKDFYRCT